MNYGPFDPDRDDSGDMAVIEEMEASLLAGETVQLARGEIGPGDIEQAVYEQEITEQRAVSELVRLHFGSRIELLRNEA